MSIYMYIHICDKKERKQHKNTEGNSQCQQSTTPQPSCGVSQVCPPPPLHSASSMHVTLANLNSSAHKVSRPTQTDSLTNKYTPKSLYPPPCAFSPSSFPLLQPFKAQNNIPFIYIYIYICIS